MIPSKLPTLAAVLAAVQVWVFLAVDLGFVFSSWAGDGFFADEGEDVVDFHAGRGGGVHFGGSLCVCAWRRVDDLDFCLFYRNCVEIAKFEVA